MVVEGLCIWLILGWVQFLPGILSWLWGSQGQDMLSWTIACYIIILNYTNHLKVAAKAKWVSFVLAYNEAQSVAQSSTGGLTNLKSPLTLLVATRLRTHHFLVGGQITP